MLRDRFGPRIDHLRPDCHRLRVNADRRLRSCLFGGGRRTEGRFCEVSAAT